MAKTNDNFKISDEDHAEGIRRRVYDAWTTSQIVDSWIEKYPQWRHIDRKKFRDASSLSNPNAKRCSAKWYKLYERTLAEFRDMRGKLLEAAAGKASTTVLQVVDKVRASVPDIPVKSAHDLLAVARVINALKTIAHHEISEINHDIGNSLSPNNNGDAVARLMRYADMADERAEEEG